MIFLSCFVFSVTTLFSQSFPNNTPVRINAGGPAGTYGGVDFERGDTPAYGNNGYTYSISSSAGAIANTLVPDLYRSESYLPHLSYTVPVLDDDCYAVHLHFAEIWFNVPGGTYGAPGYRVFDVVINGETVLEDFDIMVETGTSLVALVRSFRVCLPPGENQVKIEFITSNLCAWEGKVSAIEIVPEGTGPVDPTFPVEWLSFETTFSGDRARIEWATASELNNDFFTVERSPDARNYEIVSRVAGAGFSDEVQVYQIEDPQPVRGTAYYRIRQTDFNGTESYSEVVSLTYRSRAAEMLVYPNPLRGHRFSLDLSGLAPERELTIRIQDVRGIPVWEEKARTDAAGNLFLEVDAGKQLSPGVYMLVAAGAAFHLTQRLVVE